tara:strand:+ start:516 stop:677 length:162 start_codon:yes stop_codon:yes gene_type:complete
MGFLIDVFNVVTAVIAVSAVVCATTSAPVNHWGMKAYKIMNILAFNVWKSEDR